METTLTLGGYTGLMEKKKESTISIFQVTPNSVFLVLVLLLEMVEAPFHGGEV